jgi:hypothetical protein
MIKGEVQDQLPAYRGGLLIDCNRFCRRNMERRFSKYGRRPKIAARIPRCLGRGVSVGCLRGAR